MDALTALWALSAVGAVLFTAGGFLLARARAASSDDEGEKTGSAEKMATMARELASVREAHANDRERHARDVAEFNLTTANLRAELAEQESTRRDEETARLEQAAHRPSPSPLHPQPATALSPSDAVRRIAGLGVIESVAVADGFGLVVAGAGQRPEALAAFGAHMAHATAQAERHLPLAGVHAMTLRDRGGQTLIVEAVDDPHLSLVTLVSPGHEPPASLSEIAAGIRVRS